MRNQMTAAALFGLSLAACSSTAYQKPVATFSGSVDAFTTARGTYASTYGREAGAVRSAIEEKALQDADPVMIATPNCVDQADKALKAATAAAGSGATLESLYSDGGAMTGGAACSITLIPSTATAPSAPAGDTHPAAFDTAAAETEAAQDTATCKSRSGADVPVSPQPTGGASAKAQAEDANALWKSIAAYSSGLNDLSSADNSKSLSDATTGTASAIKTAGGSIKSKAFAPATDLLFLVFDKAVEQQRYEALKTAVICANPLFIRWRGTLRDSLRYEQIAAFSNEAMLFKADTGLLHASYDPDPNPDADCPTGAAAAEGGAPASKPRRHHRRKADAQAAAPAVAPIAKVMTSGCVIARARQVVADPQSTLQAIFSAREFLADRAARFEPRLTAVQAEAASANALATADPGPAVDAFIAAHRALRSAILANDGQFTALESSVDDLYKAATALQTALKPAAPAK
jgi:hypothetical protein